MRLRTFIVFGISILMISCQDARKPSAIDLEVENQPKTRSEISLTNHFDCSAIQFSSIQAQADSLTEFMNQAVDADQSNESYWERKFFCAFPNSFDEMQSLFGYDDSLGAAPLYSQEKPSMKYMNKHIFSDVIGFFSGLKSIPEEEYYEKYIQININGYWQADNINEAFGFYHAIIGNAESVSSVLSRYSDKEIKSVFRFIFDGPHPENDENDKYFENLSLELDKHDERLVLLLTEAYEDLVAEDDGHGH